MERHWSFDEDHLLSGSTGTEVNVHQSMCEFEKKKNIGVGALYGLKSNLID